MASFVAEQTSASFAVEIPVDDFIAISNRDKDLCGSNTLFQLLEAIPGISGVEYNGHFGSNIFYTLDSEHADHAPVLSVIEQYIALSTTGTPEQDKSYLPFWGTSEP